MSISSIGSSSAWSAWSAVHAQSARSGSTQGATASSATYSASELFSSWDGDGDGSVTEQEFGDALDTLLARLNEQVGSAGRGVPGMGGPGGMPPPPPQGEEGGFTVDELGAQLEEIGDSDPARASLLSSVIENFETADSDGDGRASFAEAMALRESLAGTSGAGSAVGTSRSAGTQAVGADLALARILQLAQAYGSSAFQSSLSQLSVSA